MCGIAGSLDPIAGRAEDRVSAINKLQQHRGPDHAVVERLGMFTIGNTRLAIQEPGPEGNQPFASPDGRYVCVFNGEIYNHRQLARRYQLDLRTLCDGEVIPALWARLGRSAIPALRGMFAIALVDTVADQIHLIRDPLGIKPLYYRSLADGTMLFSSEVRPLASFGPSPVLDADAVARYLYLGAMGSEQSPYREIKALAPGEMVTCTRDGAVESSGADRAVSFTDGGPGLGPALTESVNLHLNADVPTALLLSSGIDSAAIAVAAASLGRQLRCVTISTGDGTDETDGAAKTAHAHGHELTVTPARLSPDDVPAFFKAMQRPTIDGLNTFLISRAIHAAGYKVALSGLGGDEVVGGYRHFAALPWLGGLRQLDRMPPIAARALYAGLSRLTPVRHAKLARLLSPGGPRDGAGLSLLQREVLPASLAASLTGGSPLRRPDSAAAFSALTAAASSSAAVRQGTFSEMALAEIGNYLQPTLLADTDSFSMAFSVELRVPFVDKEVLSAALRQSGHRRRPPGKAVIAASLGSPYLAGLAHQPKRGFTVPMRQWLSGPLRQLLDDTGDPSAPLWSVLDRAAARQAGLLPLVAGDRWSETWALASLNNWLAS